MKTGQPVGGASGLAGYADGFRTMLEARGYAPDSVRWRLRQLRALDRWLAEHRLTPGDLDAACVDLLVADRRAAGRTTLVRAANFSLPITYLRDFGVVPAEGRIDPAAHLLERYRVYLVNERGLATSSVPVNITVAQQFCHAMGPRIEHLSPTDVTGYATRVCARSSIGWSKKTVSGLASFLRFLHVTGMIDEPLVAGLPRVAGHRRRIPCEVSVDDFHHLLTSCDLGRDVGLRDAAIMTILWHLGLRRGEAAGLLVDDIDWRRGVLAVRGKGNHHELLPIPIDVGETVVRYLRDGNRRVPPGCRALFVRVRAPEGAMSPVGIGDVVTRAARRAGLPPIGAHQLRHATATGLARNRATWPEISQLLRHRTAAVTASYTSVESDLTRELARPWPVVRYG